MMASEKNDKSLQIFTVPTRDSFPLKKDDEREKFWHIDKEMLRFKMHYFLSFGTLGICSPYLTIFAQKRVGISSSALAAILTAHRCICIFSRPIIAYFADYLNKLKMTIYVLLMVFTVFNIMLLSVPKIEKGKISFENNSTFNEIFTTSEALDIVEINLNSSPSAEGIFNSKKVNNVCFQSFHQVTGFLNLSYNKNYYDEAGDRIVYNTYLGKKLNAMNHSSNYFLCIICCEFTKKCQNVDCENPKNPSDKISTEKKTNSDLQTYQFWLFAFITAVTTVCTNSFITLTDTACCESVQKTGNEFGRQSLWGSIGYGLMSPISGLINDYTGDFLATWILTAFMSFISLLNLAKLEIIKPEVSKNLLKDAGTVLSSKEFLAFAFCVLMNGVGTGIVWFYLPLFLTDIGASRFLYGMVMFIQCFCGEIPFMFFSGWVIKKIGHFNVLTLALAAMLFRFLWYSQLHNPWLVLPTEVLNGITEGLLYTTVASYAKVSSKPGIEATTQAVLFTAYGAIGVGIGCIVAGLGFDSIGGHKTFLYTSIYTGCAVILSIILHLLFRNQKRCITFPTSINA